MLGPELEAREMEGGEKRGRKPKKLRPWAVLPGAGEEARELLS